MKLVHFVVFDILEPVHDATAYLEVGRSRF
jgi:hypothetical protein